MSYATVTQFTSRYDVRRLGDLVADDGTRATGTVLTSSTRLQAALDDAQGRIDAACQKGNRYLPADLRALAALTDDTDPLWGAHSLLVRLNCQVALGLLAAGRAYPEAERQEAEAEQYLEALAQGERVFGQEKTRLSGLPQRVTLSKNIVLLTEVADRYFGQLDYQTRN